MDNDLLDDVIVGFIGPSVHPNESAGPNDSVGSRQTPPSHGLVDQSKLIEGIAILAIQRDIGDSGGCFHHRRTTISICNESAWMPL